MRYQVVAKDGILRQATGESWPCGAFISPHNWPKARFQALVDEGVIKSLSDDEPVIDATPTAISRAAENDIRLADIQGTGKDGRVIASDVDEYIMDHAE